MITATVSEAGSTPPTNNSWPIFVNFGAFNTTFYTGIGGGDVVDDGAPSWRPSAALPPVRRCPLVG